MWISGQKNTPAGEFTCGFSLVSFLFVFICLQIRSQRSFCLLLLSYQTHKAFPSEASARLSCSQAYGSNRVPLKKKKEGSTHINASHQMSPLVKRRVTFNSNICSVSFYHTPQFTVSSFLSFFIFYLQEEQTTHWFISTSGFTHQPTLSIGAHKKLKSPDG